MDLNTFFNTLIHAISINGDARTNERTGASQGLPQGGLRKPPAVHVPGNGVIAGPSSFPSTQCPVLHVSWALALLFVVTLVYVVLVIAIEPFSHCQGFPPLLGSA